MVGQVNVYKDDRCDLDFGGWGEHGLVPRQACVDEGILVSSAKTGNVLSSALDMASVMLSRAYASAFWVCRVDCATMLKCPKDCSGDDHGICVPRVSILAIITSAGDALHRVATTSDESSYL